MSGETSTVIINGVERDAVLAREDDGVPYWQALTHVVNHGTQHRSESAVLLTGAGKSPRDLDMIDYAMTIVKELDT